MNGTARHKLGELRGRLQARQIILESDIASTQKIIEQMTSEWYKGYMSAQLVKLSEWNDTNTILLSEVNEIIKELDGES